MHVCIALQWLVFSPLSHRTDITGAINHAYGVSAYIDLFGWLHDANLVLNVLMSVISKREVIPDVLYLQLDNTARENKNQYVMGFLALLVELGVFKEVGSLSWIYVALAYILD